MNSELKQAVLELSNIGWDIKLHSCPIALPDDIALRYPWMQRAVASLISEIELASKRNGKLWILSSLDFRGESDSAYVWNECEIQSLAAAQGDNKWAAEIATFWDGHFPIAFSVEDDYAFYALKPDQTVVFGRAPEFEETAFFSNSYLEFLIRARVSQI